VNVAVVSRRNVKRQGVAVVYHHAVPAQVDPALFGIAADGHIKGANIAAAVPLMPEWNRQRQQIDRLALKNVFHQRPRVDDPRRDHLRVIQTFFPCVDELVARVIKRQVIGQTLSPEGGIVYAR
jgi:hypothetical protein